MAKIMEKPEDFIKYELGNLVFNNIVLATENSVLKQEVARLTEDAEKKSDKSK